jgi:hypothetical protein
MPITMLALFAEVACLLIGCVGVMYGMYVSVRQRTTEPFAPNRVRQHLRVANILLFTGTVGFLAVAITFNVWPGQVRQQFGQPPVAALSRGIDVPVATSVLFAFALIGGWICAAVSAVFFRRLLLRMRAGDNRTGAQLGDVLLGCLPFAPLLYTIFGFLFWLARVSGTSLGMLIGAPPRWLMPALIMWLVLIFTLGYRTARFIKLRPNSSLHLSRRR